MGGRLSARETDLMWVSIDSRQRAGILWYFYGESVMVVKFSYLLC